MTTPTQAAQAVQQDPLSDEYVNAVIQRHGYDSPETVIASLAQWIGRHGGENSVTLLMYEAHKALSALSKLRAPVADEREAFETWNSMHGQYRRSDAYERLDTGDYVKWPVEHGWRVWQARAALASAPVTGEARPVAWMVYASDTHQLKRIVTTDPGDTASFGCLKLPLYAAPQASSVAGEAVAGYLVGKDYFRPDVLAAARIYAEQRNMPVRALCFADAAPQAPAGWRWTLHPAGLHPDVYAAAAARDSSEDVRNAALEEAIEAVTTLHEGDDAVYLPDIAKAIETLKSTSAPTVADGGDDVALPPLPHPTAHRRHAMFAGSQMTSYAKEAVLADRQQRADDSLDAEDAKCWRWMWNHAENVSFSYSLNSTTRTMVSGLHCGSLKDVVVAARTDHRRCSGTATEGFLENIRSLADGLMGGNPSRPEMREAARLLQNFYLEQRGDLAEALRPFAGVEEADLVGTVFQGKDDDEVMLYFHRTGKSITLGDFRRARAALAARKEDGNAN
ncbi:hypothetical protein [Bordetella bronchiseptica]|uniref:hypothetical protein n=1 Tax=Bordetella bronchiseptica TaxID=518 RepID=UPI0004A01731|nr:hypothetical protein [Bordetella bronchiseptica]KDB58501.1 hypothetical protein AZ15_1977 [Bordetella bronchiseptica A1-7]KDB69684.1 hypothetical protein AZ21_3787 [Bordetella bronchiseptica B20-10725633]KDB70731.1 hypothetical protein AZ21_1769 [Bordetella bronchiseptica B20-10725633]KDB73058.1 hypothetical protein AZ21_2211 [Bordetella bronchiseptica B20-10725633]